MKRRTVVIVMSFVLVLTVISSSLPATAASNAQGPKSEPRGNASGLSALDIAKFVSDKALNASVMRGFGFLFSALGLDGRSPDSAVLQELKDQLQNISDQIVIVQASIDTLNANVLQNGLDSQLIGLRTQTRTVKDVFDTAFRPVLIDVIALDKARKNGTQTDIDAAVEKLKRSRAAFVSRFDTRGVGETPGNIHDALVPGSATSILAAMGKVLLTQRRYLTTQTSRDIRTLFDGLRQWEALAAYMRMERYIPTDPNAPDAWDTHELVRKEHLANSVLEFRYLPPMLPRDVVIDAGPVSTLRTSTNNVQMFLPASDLGDLRSRPGLTTGNPIDAARNKVNVEFRATFGDWQVPSQPALSGLLGGFAPAAGSTPNAYLSALNTTSPAWQAIAKTPWQLIWSSNVVDQPVRCSGLVAGRTVFQTVTFPSNTAVSVGTPTPVWSPRPKLDTERQSSSSDPAGVCRAYGESQFASANASARFMASRTTGTMRMDYTAIGGNYNIKAGANLREADLTNFNLEGVDLTGVNLVGAKLQGTMLSKADLTAANLGGAHFDGTNLSGADLTNANLAGITSVGVVGVPAALPAGWQVIGGTLVGPGADLSNTDLSAGADLPVHIDLSAANLTGVTSGNTTCSGGCTLPQGWQLLNGYLVGPGANLRGADLENADLREVDLREANLTDVNFLAADLTNAILTGANVTGTRFNGAMLDGVRSGNLVVDNGRNPVIDSVWRFLKGFLIGPRVDLSRADGSGLDLTGANLAGADLTGINLTNANLTNADLRSAILTGATVTGANFNNTTTFNLAGIVSGGLIGTPAAILAPYRVAYGYFLGPNVDLGSAQLPGAHVLQLGQQFSNANFTGANLKGAVLIGTTMSNAIFTDATLENANLGGSIMRNAQLRGVRSGGITGSAPANLPNGWRLINGYLVGPGANLEGANLNGANLSGMDLRGANLRFSSLSSVNFTGTNLDGVFMAGSIMSNATFSNTRCADGVVRSSVCPFSPKGLSTVTLSSNPAQTSLVANVDPDLGGTTSWQVVVELLTQPGGFVAVAEYTMKGKGETINLNLNTGTYRMYVKGQNGYAPSISENVTLKR
jgi:uncharacterized protein YjbI with pentapeptide repeats